MTSTSDLTPFILLQQLESSVRNTAVGLPEQDEVTETWSGIGFRLGDHYFVSPMSEVTELLRVPAYTRLPNVKPWVMGVSNVRGRLIPLVDLNIFFETNSNNPLRSRRVLVTEQSEQADGLIVDGVEGMQYFPSESFQGDIPDLPDAMKPYILGYFIKDNRTWSRFCMNTLGGHDQFRDVSV